MPSYPLKFVAFNITPDNHNPAWREVDLIYITRWQRLSERVSQEVFELGGHTFELSFVFNKCIALFEKHHALGKRILDERDMSAFEEFGRGPLEISATITGNDISDHYSSSVLEYLVYEFFIAMNLSAPGSFNPSSSYVVNDPPRKNVYPLSNSTIHHHDEHMTMGSSSLSPRVTSAIVSSNFEQSAPLMTGADPKV
jgi:hypothetical protein